MRCIQLDFASEAISGSFYSYQIKAAYMIADSINVIGNSAFCISFKHFYSQLSLERKVKLLYRNGACEEELKETIEEYYSFHKIIKQLIP